MVQLEDVWIQASVKVGIIFDGLHGIADCVLEVKVGLVLALVENVRGVGSVAPAGHHRATYSGNAPAGEMRYMLR